MVLNTLLVSQYDWHCDQKRIIGYSRSCDYVYRQPSKGDLGKKEKAVGKTVELIVIFTNLGRLQYLIGRNEP